MQRTIHGDVLKVLAVWTAATACALAMAQATSASTCALQPDGTPCSDGLFCNGAETCQSGTCTPGAPPCTAGQICSEAETQCLSLSNPCPPEPRGDCRTSIKSTLLIADRTNRASDKLFWRFVKGARTTQADLQEPRTTADYALCIYAGTADALAAHLNVPPNRTKWRPLGAAGYKFLDSGRVNDGVQQVVVKGGGTWRSRMLVKGRGVNLPDAFATGPLALPVTVQFINYETGVCFGGTFQHALASTPAFFKAQAP